MIICSGHLFSMLDSIEYNFDVMRMLYGETPLVRNRNQAMPSGRLLGRLYPYKQCTYFDSALLDLEIPQENFYRCFCDQPEKDIRILSPKKNKTFLCECDIIRRLVKDKSGCMLPWLRGWQDPSSSASPPLSTSSYTDVEKIKFGKLKQCKTQESSVYRTSSFQHYSDSSDYIREYRKKHVQRLVGSDGQTKNLVLGENVCDPYNFKTVHYR